MGNAHWAKHQMTQFPAHHAPLLMISVCLVYRMSATPANMAILLSIKHVSHAMAYLPNVYHVMKGLVLSASTVMLWILRNV